MLAHLTSKQTLVLYKINNLIIYSIFITEIFQVIDARTKKFQNSIHRIWNGFNPEVRIYKAEHIEKVFSSHKHNDKSTFYDFIQPWLGEGLIVTKGIIIIFIIESIIGKIMRFKNSFC